MHNHCDINFSYYIQWFTLELIVWLVNVPTLSCRPLEICTQNITLNIKIFLVFCVYCNFFGFLFYYFHHHIYQFDTGRHTKKAKPVLISILIVSFMHGLFSVLCLNLLCIHTYSLLFVFILIYFLNLYFLQTYQVVVSILIKTI